MTASIREIDAERLRLARRYADLTNCLAFAAECAGEMWQARRLANDSTRLTARADKLSRRIKSRS